MCFSNKINRTKKWHATHLAASLVSVMIDLGRGVVLSSRQAVLHFHFFRKLIVLSGITPLLCRKADEPSSNQGWKAEMVWCFTCCSDTSARERERAGL